MSDTDIVIMEPDRAGSGREDRLSHGQGLWEETGEDRVVFCLTVASAEVTARQ